MRPQGSIFIAQREFVMKKIFSFSLTLIVLGHLSFSQDEFFETWYVADENGGMSKHRLVINADSVISERFQEYGNKEWRLDKVTLIDTSKTIENGLQIIFFDSKNKVYTGGELTYDANLEDMMFLHLKDTSSVLDSTFSNLDKYRYKVLFSKKFYNEKKIKEIEKFPGLDQSSKEEMILLFEYMWRFEELFDAFVEERADDKASNLLLSKALDTMRDHQFIKMGFNPYKKTGNDFADLFKDDPDLVEMNERSKHFKLF